MAARRGPRPAPYITPDGAARFREELTLLWTVERPRVTQGVADAAAEGDLSEIAEYIYGKKRLRQIDRRIRYLEKRLDELEVVVPDAGRRDDTQVFFGAWVRLEDDEGRESVHRIVGADETDMDPHYVSLDAPLAKALLRKRVDDEVTVRTPKGVRELTVLEVAYARFDDLPPPETAPTRRWGV